MIQNMTYKIFLRDFEVMAFIGFHDFERVEKQRVFITIEIELDVKLYPITDHRRAVWDYDFIRVEIHKMLEVKHYELQETLCKQIFDMIKAKPGVSKLMVRSAKPDVYSDIRLVGCELSSD